MDEKKYTDQDVLRILNGLIEHEKSTMNAPSFVDDLLCDQDLPVSVECRQGLARLWKRCSCDTLDNLFQLAEGSDWGEWLD